MAQSMSLIIMAFVAIVWISQLLDLLFRDVSYFDNHTHKLTWFLVIMTSSVIGAVWYYFWRRAATPKPIGRDYA